MKNKRCDPSSDSSVKALRKKYQSPRLSHFGSVTQLTNSFTSNCKADDGTCTSSPGNNMGPKLPK